MGARIGTAIAKATLYVSFIKQEIGTTRKPKMKEIQDFRVGGQSFLWFILLSLTSGNCSYL